MRRHTATIWERWHSLRLSPGCKQHKPDREQRDLTQVRAEISPRSEERSRVEMHRRQARNNPQRKSVDHQQYGITTPNGKNRTPSSKIPRGRLQRKLAGVSANEVEVKGYQITSCRKKGALMKFYDVAWLKASTARP